MLNNYATYKPVQAVNDEPELILNSDELVQLAKFLDALLEVDITNQHKGTVG